MNKELYENFKTAFKTGLEAIVTMCKALASALEELSKEDKEILKMWTELDE